MNLTDLFAKIELDLLTHMTKSIQSEDWRSRRFRAFKDFQKRNAAMLDQYDIDGELKRALQSAYLKAGYATEADIEKAMEEGHKAQRTGTSFSVNDKKLTALTEELSGQFKTAQTAILRRVDDMYRQGIVKTQAMLETNLYTLNQCVDIATKDFLASGINCIRYKNGAQVNIASYAEMALRTGNRRATLTGEGAVRKDWGEHLVYVSQYGACSPTCLPWQGQIYVDDVYSGGKARPEYPSLSLAVAGGLFHPNCRHKSSTWYPDISNVPHMMAEKPTTEHYALEQKQRYNERQIRKYKRLSAGSLDPANKAKYDLKVKQWQAAQRELIRANPDVLRRDYSREGIRGIFGEKKFAPEPPKIEYKQHNSSGFRNKQEEADALNKLFPKANLTKGQLDSINGYTKENYEAINFKLRGVQDTPYRVVKNLDKEVENITSALDRPVGQNITVSRYQDGHNKSFEEWKRSVGTSFVDPGFVSTKVESTPINYKDVSFKIDVPSDAKGLYIGNLSSYKLEEKELILQRNTKFKVVDVFKNSLGNTEVHLVIER